MDVTEDLLAKVKTYLGEEAKRVRNYFCCGFQNFSPELSCYDAVWIKQLIGHLMDQRLTDFLQYRKWRLCLSCMIAIKNNMAQECMILDDVESIMCHDLKVVTPNHPQCGPRMISAMSRALP